MDDTVADVLYVRLVETGILFKKAEEVLESAVMIFNLFNLLLLELF